MGLQADLGLNPATGTNCDVTWGDGLDLSRPPFLCLEVGLVKAASRSDGSIP